MKKKKQPKWVTEGRPEEVIGGGFIVMRRYADSGRIRPAVFPFEYAHRGAAEAQAKRLADMNPGFSFEVFSSNGVIFRSAESKETEAA